MEKRTKMRKKKNTSRGVVVDERTRGEQSIPQKQSTLLDCMQKIMLEMSLADVMDLD